MGVVRCLMTNSKEEKMKPAELFVIYNFDHYEHTVPCFQMNPCCWRALIVSMKQAGFSQRLLHDYTHEKRQVWDKADLNLFQYSRLCQIMDFQPPGHWDRPNFCEVMRDNNLDTIFVSFERVPEWIAKTEVTYTEMKKPLASLPFEADHCPGCTR